VKSETRMKVLSYQVYAGKNVLFHFDKKKYNGND